MRRRALAGLLSIVVATALGIAPAAQADAEPVTLTAPAPLPTHGHGKVTCTSKLTCKLLKWICLHPKSSGWGYQEVVYSENLVSGSCDTYEP